MYVCLSLEGMTGIFVMSIIMLRELEHIPTFASYMGLDVEISIKRIYSVCQCNVKSSGHGLTELIPTWDRKR